MTDSSEQVARRIRAILQDRGWTVRRLSVETGWGYQHTTRLVRGARPIPLRFAVACELALGLPTGLLSRCERVTV